MEHAVERQRLGLELEGLALAGLALLRLHAARDLAGADECVAEMRELLASIDRAGNPLDVRNPLVDVVDGYRRWADVYDLPGNPLITCEEPAVRPMLDRFEEDPVLDAACGTGRHLAYLAQVGRRVVGTDISPDMLDKA